MKRLIMRLACFFWKHDWPWDEMTFIEGNTLEGHMIRFRKLMRGDFTCRRCGTLFSDRHPALKAKDIGID